MAAAIALKVGSSAGVAGASTVTSSLALLSPTGLSVDLPSSAFVVPALESELASALPFALLSDLLLALASLCAVVSDWAELLVLLSLAELVFDEPVLLLLRAESAVDELVLLERCDGGSDDDEAEDAAGIAASTIAAKLSPNCGESVRADFGVLV
jgi:hypothetical protein